MDDGAVCKGWCFEGGADSSYRVFHDVNNIGVCDVNHIGVFKRRVEEEAGEPLLHLLDTLGLLYLVFFSAGEHALHYGGYPVVLFGVVVASHEIFVPAAPWNNIFSDGCS